MISFNEPPFIPQSARYMHQAAESGFIEGDGPFTKRCNQWLEARFDAQKVLLTTSGTSALEMAAHLCHLEPGDEVILPSFTFSSTATAFVGVGARLVFVDVQPDTMNIDPACIAAAITERTRVIAVVHYAGVSCDMDAIMDLAREHNLLVVEDAAQGVMSSYKGRALGTIGDIGCYSFHATKNYSMGEGGACLINDARRNEEAEILREKGTNRSLFFRGQVDKYSWVGYGSSYLPSDLNAAFLYGQLECADEINNKRLALWDAYNQAFAPLAARGACKLPLVPADCVHNAHMYYLRCADLSQRTRFIDFLKARDVMAVFHYIPLHSSVAGQKYGCLAGEDRITTAHSEQLVRLPLYFGLSAQDQSVIIAAVHDFFETDTDSNL